MDVLGSSAVNGLLMLIAGLLGIRWLRDAVEVSRTRVVRMAPNSNEEAEQSFLDLLREAQNEIVMYDDGDTDEKSLYQSETVVEAIKNKIQENSRFRVDCVLNDRKGATRFERELGGESAVRIRRRRDDPSRIHYKIIDGRKAYVSCHAPGGTARNRTVIDCTNALSRHRHRGVRPLALRRYFDDFERHAA